jgi:cyclopropane fatty-acyl-phospholipid synthase-like methyltransferase
MVFDPTPQTISNAYYNKTYYSTIDHLPNKFKDRLHYYRIKNILKIYTPRPTETVVDLGCAWGELCFTLHKTCQKIIGADFSEKVVNFCNTFMRERRISNIFFYCADAQYTALRSDTVDTVIAADLFEHLYREQFFATLDECRRILKPGGKLVIWTPHRGHIIERLKNNDIILKRDPAHVDYKSMEIMKTGLRQRNFHIEKSYYVESHLPLFNLLEKIALPIVPLFRRRIAILAKKLPEIAAQFE